MEPYYRRAGVVLYCADCRDVLPTLERESVDLVVTDPPYGVSWRSNRRAEAFDEIAGDDDSSWVPSALTMAGMALRRNRHAYIFGDFELEEFPLRHRCQLVWDKTMTGLGDLALCWGPSHEQIMFCVRAPDRNKTNMDRGAVPARLRSGTVLRYQRPNATGARRHPTEKPVPLLRRLIESSTWPGEVVLDPFAGSCSTLVAAVAEGRRAVGVEVSERYCSDAASRLDSVLDAARALDEAAR